MIIESETRNVELYSIDKNCNLHHTIPSNRYYFHEVSLNYTHKPTGSRSAPRSPEAAQLTTTPPLNTSSTTTAKFCPTNNPGTDCLSGNGGAFTTLTISLCILLNGGVSLNVLLPTATSARRGTVTLAHARYTISTVQGWGF